MKKTEETGIDQSPPARIARRRFLGAAVSAGAGTALGGLIAPADAGVLFPAQPGTFGAGGSSAGAVHRSENTLFDCEVEGDFPADLDGAFYRVGPDPQYPKEQAYRGDIAFDGEGHVAMFRIKGGHVDYRSRYVRNERWKAQHAARKSLFGMYRNPLTDDPSVKGLHRGTANTQVFYHHGKLFAMKEDSPPVLLDPHTLETTDDAHTFNGGLKGETFTAHPKVDSETGEMLAFGYEAKGLGSTDVFVFSVDRQGTPNWSTWLKVPYAGMVHDFAVTSRHIAFLVIPLATNMDLIRKGGPHFAWDSTLPSYLGVMRRGGDGKDIRWFKGPGWMATHVMGAWSEGEKLYVDMDGGESNQFSFFPQLHETYDARKAAGYVTRLSVDLRNRSTSYTKEVMYPDVMGALSRQDDRYHTVPYRYGYLMSFGPAGSRWALFDHQTRKTRFYSPGPDAGVSEMCFVPRKRGASEGDGYLIGIVERRKENGRSDLVLVDTQSPEDGPIATVKMPYRVPPQVHGFWVAGQDLPPSPPSI